MPAARLSRLSRTAAFAAAIQCRGRLLRGRRRCQHAARVPTVFRSPVRLRVQPQGPPVAASLALRLGFEWRISVAGTLAAQRDARSDGRRPKGGRTGAAARATSHLVTTQDGTSVRAPQPAAVMMLRCPPSMRRGPDGAGTRAAVVADNQVVARPTRTPQPVAMVHRAQTSAAQPVPAPTRQRPGTDITITGWPPNLPPAAPPLTTADLPTVINRVVNELDRRVIAARERKGWTA
jgi:hypothetical protein